MELWQGIFFWGFLVVFGVVMLVVSPKAKTINSFFRGYDEKGQHRVAYCREGGRVGVGVSLFPPPHPGYCVLHYAQRANDRAVNAAEEERQHEEKYDDSCVQGQQGRQELDFGHPPQPRVYRSRKVEEQQCDTGEEEDSQDASGFA